jgi:DMSO/TMAO reductase YedYZ molybdopterin-dependent catalytic subunit
VASLPKSLLRSPSRRLTNLALGVALAVAFGTGAGAMATGSPHGRWVVIAHGVVGIAVVLLIPWKSRVVRHGWRRLRSSRYMSLLLAGLTVLALVTGLGHTTGVLRSIGGTSAMWLHVAAGLALAPLAVWHVAARPARPRPTDLSRRVLLRAGLLGVAAASLYAASASTVTLLRLPGTQRRFTGSYEQGSFEPAAMPETIWLDDSVPHVDAATWRLQVVDGDGQYELTLADLQAYETSLRATLDCTSGWFAHQDWSGVPVSALLRRVGDARSLLVRSMTGYWVRLPVRDIDRLLLARQVGGQPLTPGHGFPLRLVAPGRRGFWWVKWVQRIELQRTPWWWQPPFPLT